ncbi:hypothetical protein M422DRAFT_36400, partial [Sphaerobolus stellatus SS14]
MWTSSSTSRAQAAYAPFAVGDPTIGGTSRAALVPCLVPLAVPSLYLHCLLSPVNCNEPRNLHLFPQNQHTKTPAMDSLQPRFTLAQNIRGYPTHLALYDIRTISGRHTQGLRAYSVIKPELRFFGADACRS